MPYSIVGGHATAANVTGFYHAQELMSLMNEQIQNLNDNTDRSSLEIKQGQGCG